MQYSKEMLYSGKDSQNSALAVTRDFPIINRAASSRTLSRLCLKPKLADKEHSGQHQVTKG